MTAEVAIMNTNFINYLTKFPCFTEEQMAGYGEREIFPTIYEFEVGGKIGKSLI
jgi:hypothetical protein